MIELKTESSLKTQTSMKQTVKMKKNKAKTGYIYREDREVIVLQR